MSQWIELDGVVNMRDLGGLPTAAGETVQPGRLIRSDNLQDLSPADVTHLVEDLGVSDIVDLRSHRETHLTGDGPLRATPLRHHHHSFFPPPTEDDQGPAFLDPQKIPRSDPSYWSQHYRGYLRARPDSVAAALEVVRTAPGATIVHCAAGKDRTGTVIGLALSVAGVERADIVADYVLTTERLDQIIDRLTKVEPYRTSLAGQSRDQQIPMAASMEQLLDVVEEEFGGAAGFLTAQGWSATDVDALRAKLIEP